VQAPAATALVTTSGAIARRREIVLSFRIPGVITGLNAEAGDTIQAGKVLATLDPAGVAARLTQSGADLERAKRDLARDKALFDQGYVSRQRLDDRQSALKAASAAYDAAAFDRRWARLVSPASGVVLTRRAQAGEVVQAGQAVLSIADETSPLIVRAPVADRDMAHVVVGQAASAQVDGWPQPVVGKVTRLGQKADAQTGSVEVEIELPPTPGLRSGQIARVSIAGSGGPTGVFSRVPAEAILEASGARAFVFLLDGKVARRAGVTFGGFDGDDALVSGLPQGAKVITSGAGFLTDGEMVSVAPSGAGL
jgi:RND family efflux transporter MFP subunit